MPEREPLVVHMVSGRHAKPQPPATAIRSRAVFALLPPRVRLTKRALVAWISGEPEMRILCNLCRGDEWALDIGANYGVYSWHLRRRAAGVIAFEPQPLLAGFLRRALDERVRVEQVALSDSDGEVLMRVPHDRMQDGRATIEQENTLAGLSSEEILVPRRRLDDMVQANGMAPVGVIKIDVEGHELSVLRGAEAVLRHNRPTLLIEAEERHRHEAFGSVERFLAPLGYHPYIHHDGGLRLLDRSASRGLSGNFFFVARPQLLDRVLRP